MLSRRRRYWLAPTRVDHVAGVRGLQKRVCLLERQRSPRTPIEIEYGSLDAFEAELQAEIDAGRMCQFDGPIILRSIRRWHREELWGSWRRQGNQMWEYGGR